MLTKKKKSPYTIACLVILAVLAFLFIFPVYWIITGSFKTAQEINSAAPTFFPQVFTLDNLFEQIEVGETKELPLSSTPLPATTKQHRGKNTNYSRFSIPPPGFLHLLPNSSYRGFSTINGTIISSIEIPPCWNVLS